MLYDKHQSFDITHLFAKDAAFINANLYSSIDQSHTEENKALLEALFYQKEELLNGNEGQVHISFDPQTEESTFWKPYLFGGSSVYVQSIQLSKKELISEIMRARKDKKRHNRYSSQP